jgi:hypothetical protein
MEIITRDRLEEYGFGKWLSYWKLHVLRELPALTRKVHEKHTKIYGQTWDDNPSRLIPILTQQMCSIGGEWIPTQKDILSNEDLGVESINMEIQATLPNMGDVILSIQQKPMELTTTGDILP